MARIHVLALGILVTGCSTATSELARLPPAVPKPPVTVEDTIVRLAVALTLWERRPAYPERPLVIRSDTGLVSERSLPVRDNVRYVLLPDPTIQRLGSRPGGFEVLTVTGRVLGDTAVVSVHHAWAGHRHMEHDSWRDSGGSCTWTLYRGRYGWQADYPARLACGGVLRLCGQFGAPSRVVWQLDWPDIDAGFPVARFPIRF